MTASSLFWRTSATAFAYTSDLTNKSDWGETKEENDHVVVFGVKPYLFKLISEAGNTAGEGQMQVHPRDGADASQWKACVLKKSRKYFHWIKIRNASALTPSLQDESSKI